MFYQNYGGATKRKLLKKPPIEPPEEPVEQPAGATPGFGLLLAVAAIGGALFLMKRKG
jgi:hypothetical protein